MNQKLLKSGSLLLLRIGTGGLMLVWGVQRLVVPGTGQHLSTRYYSSLFNDRSLQLGFGAFEILIGGLVILGLFRRFAFLVQAAVLVCGAAFIWRHLLDPLGLYLLNKNDSQILFFPSLTVAAATLVLLAFLDEDCWSLDARAKGMRRT